MLSAVESFGPAAASATNAYAAAAAAHHHHNPFAIAASVMPPTQNQSENQVNLDHYTLGHGPLLSHHPHLNPLNHHHLSHPSGIYLSPLPPVPPSSTMSLLQQQQQLSIVSSTLLPSPSSSIYSSSSSATSIISPCSSPAKSPSSTIRSIKDFNSGIINNNNNLTESKSSTVLSISEFVRPHPKQPRYNTNSNNSNNNINHNNLNINSINNNNNNTIGSNGIPLLGRHNSKTSNNCVNLSGSNLVTKRTKYSAEPQTGPVNLVTNNNSNNINNNNDCKENNNISKQNNSNRISPTTSDLECDRSQNLSTSSSDTLTGTLYSQKMQFPPPAAALAAAAYQFSYPTLYARGPLYGSPALYSSHPVLNGRNQVLNRPTFMSSAHDLPFSPYLAPTVPYSPPAVSGTNAVQLQQSTTNLHRSHLSTVGLLNDSLPTSQSQQQLPLASISPPSQQTSHSLQLQQSPSHQQQSLVPQSTLPHSNLINGQHSMMDSHSMQFQHGKERLSGKSISENACPSNGFKVPSGKEGSLKHRFLTRPKSDRDSKRRSPISACIIRSSGNSSAPSNFTKGSYIELSNGFLRRVEDMRTEDFIQSAEKSEHHQLVDSTVVKISNNSNSVIITFSYDKNRSKADVEVSQDHPFFVYGQGWASCNTELSLQSFGLKCKRLQVGDVCISLIETTSQIHNGTSEFAVKHSPSIDVTSIPQNLSSSGIITTQALTTVSHSLPQFPYDLAATYDETTISRHHQAACTAVVNVSAANVSPIYHNSHLILQNGTGHDSIHHRINFTGKHLSLPDRQYLALPPPPQSSLSSFKGTEFKFSPPHLKQQHQPYYLGKTTIPSCRSASPPEGHDLTIPDRAFDVSVSRKRRWSAPEDKCEENDNEKSANDDDKDCQPTVTKTLNSY